MNGNMRDSTEPAGHGRGSSAPIFDLDSLDVPAGEIVINGRTVEVRHPDGHTFNLVRLLESGDESLPISDVYDVAHRLLPSLTRDEVDRLTARQVGRVLGIALGRPGGAAEKFASGENSPPDAAGADTGAGASS